MADIYLIEVPGKAVAAQRPRVTRHGTFNPKEKELKTLAQVLYLERPAAAPFGPGTAIDLKLDFYCAIPASYHAWKKRAIENNSVRHTKRPDIDNLAKQILDALTLAGYWDDDARVRRISAGKYYGDPKTKIQLTVYSEPQTAKEYASQEV